MRRIDDWSQLRVKYLNGNRRVKGEIIRSLELLHGYHRTSAIRLPVKVLSETLWGSKP